jgi:hypothetical protein
MAIDEQGQLNSVKGSLGLGMTHGLVITYDDASFSVSIVYQPVRFALQTFRRMKRGKTSN